MGPTQKSVEREPAAQRGPVPLAGSGDKAQPPGRRQSNGAGTAFEGVPAVRRDHGWTKSPGFALNVVTTCLFNLV